MLIFVMIKNLILNVLQLKMLRKTEENGFSTSAIYEFYGFYYFSNTKRASPIENVT